MAAELNNALVSFPDLSLLYPPDPVDIKPLYGQTDVKKFASL